MGFRKDIIKSQIYMESDEIFNNMWFSFKRDKFLHNIDTFYYTVSIKNDHNKNSDLDDFLCELSDKKSEFLTKKEPVNFNDKLFIQRGRFDDIYEYRLACPDKYDIFVTSYLPNKSTPRIVVQIRSIALWIDGVKQSIEDSYYQIYKLLGSYGLEVSNVYENRIDYCYHTNYIQDMYRFFGDMKINKEIKTNMKHWRKDGLIFDDGLELNYFALGNRTSNNVFIRIYDKTREVIEMAYKGFFLEVWFRQGLISAYDKYVLEYAYRHRNYEKRFEGMLHFYLEHGKDELHKNEINNYFKDVDINFNQIKELALSLLPQTTTMCNIEFQTKRKFYYYGDEQIESFDVILKGCKKLDRLYKIIDNRKVFLNYLTHYNLRFVDVNGKYKSWWSRLRGLKMNVLDKGCEYARKYQYNLDKDKIMKNAIRTIATHSLYENKLNSNFIEDITDLIASLNDNDIYGGKFEILSESVGELVSDLDSKLLIDYDIYKNKKYKTIKSRVCDNNIENEENKKKSTKSFDKISQKTHGTSNNEIGKNIISHKHKK